MARALQKSKRAEQNNACVFQNYGASLLHTINSKGEHRWQTTKTKTTSLANRVAAKVAAKVEAKVARAVPAAVRVDPAVVNRAVAAASGRRGPNGPRFFITAFVNWRITWPIKNKASAIKTKAVKAAPAADQANPAADKAAAVKCACRDGAAGPTSSQSIENIGGHHGYEQPMEPESQHESAEQQGRQPA